jgi:hypothetical protein
VARQLGISARAVLERRRNIEGRTGAVLDLSGHKGKTGGHEELEKFATFTVTPGEWRYLIDICNGQVVIGSDCHYQPGIVSTAHKAFVAVAHKLQPAAVILNGDVFDGAAVSRHFRIKWQTIPSVNQELEAVRDRLAEIEAVAGNAKLIRTWGNHDSRFETFLSGQVPQYEGVQGFRLRDHLPLWQECMSVHINGDRGTGAVVVKHRFKGGVHATHNNTKDAGRSMVTGHLHSQKVTPWTDYNGTRYGVDSGTMASPEDAAFEYAEDDPRNWRSGFAVLTFVDGALMPPDLCQVIGPGRVYFRGEVLDV